MLSEVLIRGADQVRHVMEIRFLLRAASQKNSVAPLLKFNIESCRIFLDDIINPGGSGRSSSDLSVPMLGTQIPEI
jgi:hypothetical protein